MQDKKEAHCHQQRRFPLQKYFIPGCIGRGLDLDLRVGSAAPGDLGFCHLGIKVEKQSFQTALITGQKFQGAGLKLKAFILTVRDPFPMYAKKIRVAV